MSIIDNGRPKDGERPKRIRVGPSRDQRLFDELSDVEKAELRAQAREKVAEERRAQARKSFLEAAIEDERTALDPEKQKVPVFLDLAGHSTYILLDGTYYHHGQTYWVEPGVAAVLLEQQARGWAHEEEVGEPNRRYYRKPSHVGTTNFARPEYDPEKGRGTTLSLKTGAVTNPPVVPA